MSGANSTTLVSNYTSVLMFKVNNITNVTINPPRNYLVYKSKSVFLSNAKGVLYIELESNDVNSFYYVYEITLLEFLKTIKSHLQGVTQVVILVLSYVGLKYIWPATVGAFFIVVEGIVLCILGGVYIVVKMVKILWSCGKQNGYTDYTQVGDLNGMSDIILGHFLWLVDIFCQFWQILRLGLDMFFFFLCFGRQLKRFGSLSR